MTPSFVSTIPSIVTDTSITVFCNGKVLTIASDHPNFDVVREALKYKDYDDLENLMNARQAVQSFLSSDPAFTLENDLVTFGGRPFSEAITNKVMSMLGEGFDADPLFNFLRNVRGNPSATAQDELLLFCEANKFLIDEDGYILAYKGVRHNYTDSYSGTIDNSVGQYIKMDRNAVNDNRNETCSFGLHFASHEYAKGYASGDGHLMIMRIHPADVVSIPVDYNNQKGRCCAYEVIAEIENGEAMPHREVYTKQDIAECAKDCAVHISGKVYYAQRDAHGHFISRRKAKRRKAGKAKRRKAGKAKGRKAGKARGRK